MAKRKIKQIGDVVVYRDAEWDEYIVRVGGDPKTDYFTDDKSDAVDTAQYLANKISCEV